MCVTFLCAARFLPRTRVRGLAQAVGEYWAALGCLFSVDLVSVSPFESDAAVFRHIICIVAEASCERPRLSAERRLRGYFVESLGIRVDCGTPAGTRAWKHRCIRQKGDKLSVSLFSLQKQNVSGYVQAEYTVLFCSDTDFQELFAMIPARSAPQ